MTGPVPARITLAPLLGCLLLAGCCAEEPPAPPDTTTTTTAATETAVGPTTRTTETHPEHGERHSMWVTATAYCSRPEETDGDPFIAAWGDRLEPGEKCIAVSRDLLDLGLVHRTPVWIEVDGEERGPYLVLDKMAKRWKDRIDLYYGLDRKAALEWGRRRVRILWKTDPTGDG
jgi:3D (Asp-Asp-Asp) domain-containing protein